MQNLSFSNMGRTRQFGAKCFGFAAILLAGLLFARQSSILKADDAKTEAPKATAADTSAIQGLWKLTAKGDGAADASPMKIRFKGDQAYHVVGEDKEELTDPAGFKLDAEKNPRQIDLTPTTGSDKGTTIQGIYKLDGDKLTLCIGESRPADFTNGEKQTVMVFDRQK